MKEVKVEEKLRADVIMTGLKLPERVGMQEELREFMRAVRDAYEDCFGQEEEDDFLTRYRREHGE